MQMFGWYKHCLLYIPLNFCMQKICPVVIHFCHEHKLGGNIKSFRGSQLEVNQVA